MPPNYKKVAWEDVKKGLPNAYDSFHKIVREWINSDAQLRAIFRMSLAVCRKLSAENVMDLFEVRVKRNWKRMIARANDSLLSMIIATDKYYQIPPECIYCITTPWWERKFYSLR